MGRRLEPRAADVISRSADPKIVGAADDAARAPS
jgi:hypothetical protein